MDSLFIALGAGVIVNHGVVTVHEELLAGKVADGSQGVDLGTLGVIAEFEVVLLQTNDDANLGFTFLIIGK